MGIVNSIRKAFAREAQGWWWETSGSKANYEIKDSYKGYEKAYNDHVWVRRCVDIVASSVASVPLRLYRIDENRKEEVKDHNLVRLLKNVNPLNMNSSDLWKATPAALRIYGNCYWYLERKGKEEPQEIYWLHPGRTQVQPHADPTKYIQSFDYDTGNPQMEGIRYYPEDIIHFKNFNPGDDYYGLSKIAGIREVISADLYAQSWNKYFFRNNTRPDGFLVAKGSLTDQQREFLKNSLKSQFQGVEQSHKMGILEEGMEYKQISTSPQDTDWLNLRIQCRDAICSALEVPPVLVAAYSASTYATAIEQKKSYWEETIIPLLKYFEETLNNKLLPQFNNTEGLWLEFDLSEVMALREQESELYDRLYKATGAPFLSPNEARAVIGKRPYKGADTLYYPLNMEQVQATEEEPELESPGGKGA